MTEGSIRTLFPQTVVVKERRIPGDPAELHPAEAEHVARAVPKRVAEFAAGRTCARAALAEFGVREFTLRAATDRQPLWPERFIGSITHTARGGVSLATRSFKSAAPVAPVRLTIALGSRSNPTTA